MNKITKLLMIVVLAFTMLFIPNVFAAEDVEIKSITLDSKSDNTTINSDATASGLVVSFDLLFKAKGDFAKYKVEIKNNTDEDYELANNSLISESEYVKYDYTFEGNSNIIPKKSTKIMYITVTYNKELPENELDADGNFVQNDEMEVSLAKAANPKTGDTVIKIFLILLLALVAGLSLLASKKSKLPKTMILMIGILVVVIPTTIYAAKSIEIKINSNITFNNRFEMAIVYEEVHCDDLGSGTEGSVSSFAPYLNISTSCEDSDEIHVYQFVGAKTWRDLVKADYDNLSDEVKEFMPLDEYVSIWFDEDGEAFEIYADEDHTKKVKVNDLIINDKVYYYVIEVDDDYLG